MLSDFFPRVGIRICNWGKLPAADITGLRSESYGCRRRRSKALHFPERSFREREPNSTGWASICSVQRYMGQRKDRSKVGGGGAGKKLLGPRNGDAVIWSDILELYIQYIYLHPGLGAPHHDYPLCSRLLILSSKLINHTC